MDSLPRIVPFNLFFSTHAFYDCLYPLSSLLFFVYLSDGGVFLLALPVRRSGYSRDLSLPSLISFALTGYLTYTIRCVVVLRSHQDFCGIV